MWDNLLMSKSRSALYVGLMVLAAALAGYMVSRQLARNLPQLVSGTALPSPRAIAPFMLADQNGQAFGDPQLQGAPSLLFFGFTHCPDVCPTTLALMAQLRRESDLSKLRFLFVTVDPTRDDQPALRQYVDAFGGGITGLRGDDNALQPLLGKLGAIRRVEARAGGDYSVDHSATLYYMNARGMLSAVFTPPLDFTRLRDDLRTLVASGY